MRMTTLTRADLRERHIRLDPAYYVGRESVRSTVNAERSRTVRLADIIETVQDGARLPVVTTGVPIIRLSNIGPCELSLASMSHADESAGKWVGVRAGDVLLTRAAKPFRAAAVPSDVPSKLAASSEISIIRPQPAVRPEYLAAVLCTPTLNRFLRDVAYRGRVAALPRFRLSDIGQLPVPLPTRSLQDALARQYQLAVRLTAEARAEITTVATAVHAEIDHRVPEFTTPSRAIETRRSSLPERWDVPFNRGRQLQESLMSSPMMQPLLRLAKPGSSSLRGLRDEDEVFAIQANDVNDATFLVEGGGHLPLTELSSRMRQRVDIGDVLMCTTGSGNQIAYVDEGIDAGRQPILGSATFTTLRFNETPRVFSVTLSHPLVREQLRLLSSGSVQRFVNKGDLDELLVPVLGQVWREDFEDRLARAMQRRREALRVRSALINAADEYMREALS